MQKKYPKPRVKWLPGVLILFFLLLLPFVLGSEGECACECGRAQILLSTFSVEPTEVYTGQNVTIGVAYTNSGYANGDKQVNVYVDGNLYKTEIIKSLPPNEVSSFEWEYEIKPTTTRGAHEVKCEDQTRTFTVKSTVDTDVATDITANSATINGFIKIPATVVNLSFEYGLDDNYDQTANSTPASLTGNGHFTASLSGLNPDTIYHFRARGIAFLGTFEYGNDQTFKTLGASPPAGPPPPDTQTPDTQPPEPQQPEPEPAAITIAPIVVTGTASNVTPNGATLSGSLSSQGSASSANVSFEYGLTTGYGNTAAGVPPALASTGDYKSTITGLKPNTKYHYRAKAEGDGTAVGADQTFTTISLSLNLHQWTAEAYNELSDEYYYPPSWYVSTDDTAIQGQNCQPALFYSDFTAMGNVVHIKITPSKTNEPDDDYFGFALGFQPGDTKNHNADYLLIDWKSDIGEALSQDFNDLTSPGTRGSATVGLAVSRVKGIPTADEFWQHTDQDVSGSPKGQGVTELKRGAKFGSSGWVFDKTYDFTFTFSQTSLKVYVNGELEIEVTGNFKDGRLAFYNFSQAGVNYSVSPE